MNIYNLKIIISTFVVTCFFSMSCPVKYTLKSHDLRLSKKALELIKEGPLKGMTLGMHSDDYEYNYINQIKEIKALNAAWIQLNIKFYQEDIHSNEIKVPEADSYFWDQLNNTIKQSKDLGFKVALLPIVLLENRGEGDWRGKISPSDKKAWYFSYNSLISKIAKIANNHGLEILSIGSEFCSMQTDKAAWLDIITTCREEFNGCIIYSANWDAIEEVDFADHLDFLGITAYFSLGTSNKPSFGDLLLEWDLLKSKILRLQNDKKTPFLFTELGYASQDGTSTNPWNYRLSDKVDETEQSLCYQAFINTWQAEKQFFGVFIYDWFGEGGAKDLGYTVKNKAAEPFIRSWFCD